MADAAHESSRPWRRGLVGVALRAASWVGTGALAWWLAIIIELFARGAVVDAGALGFAAAHAAVWSLAGSAAVGVAVAVHRRLRRFALRPASITLAVTAAATVWPAIGQARFLTAGDGIAGHPWVLALRIGLAALVVLGSCGLCAWFLLTPGRGLWRVDANSPGDRPPFVALWWAIGLAGALLSAWLIAARLDFYARTAVALAFPCWLLAATVTRRALEGAHERAVPGALALVAIFGLGGFENEPGRAQVLSRSKLANTAELLVGGPARTSDFRIDFDQPGRFACAPAVARDPGSLPIADARRRNVIVVSIDALRADVVDLELRGVKVMPELAAFGARAWRYESAVTSYPATIFAMGGAFTGLSPSQILYAPRVPENVLARAHGRVDRRIAVLPTDPWFELPIIDTLLVQGTPVQRVEADAEATTRAVVEELRAARAAGESIFLWAHYLEPHEPYRYHEGFDYGGGGREAYLSEVSYLDHHLGPLFEELAQGGWLDDSLVIVLSDHGEALGERGYWGHHVYLDAWLTDVPLIVAVPEASARTIAATVGLVDVAPTIEHFLGLPPGADSEGVSLLSAAANEPRALVSEAFPVRGQELFELATRPITTLEELQERERVVQSAVAGSYEPKVSLVRDGHRLIAARRSGSTVLHRRGIDPNEERDLSADDASRATAMREGLREWHRRRSESIYCRVVESVR